MRGETLLRQDDVLTHPSAGETGGKGHGTPGCVAEVGSVVLLWGLLKSFPGGSELESPPGSEEFRARVRCRL